MTTATDVRIVSATRDHIPIVGWTVMTAGRSQLERGLWELTLGTDSEAEMLPYMEALADTDIIHWAHWSLFMVAEVDGVPAAAMCGFFENEYSSSTLVQGVMEADKKAGRSQEEFAAGWQRAGSIANIERKHEPGAWIVEHVATRPEFRRRGLTERLVHAMLDRGRERGAKTAEIGVLIGNDKAQKAYEKCGFEVYQEARDGAFEAAYKCPGAYYLKRSI